VVALGGGPRPVRARTLPLQPVAPAPDTTATVPAIPLDSMPADTAATPAPADTVPLPVPTPPPPAPMPADTARGTFPREARTHRVEPGETLFGLARRYSVPVELLRSANDLKNDTIYAGQVLRIPAPPKR